MPAKKSLGTILKVASVALLGYLVYRASSDPQFRTLAAGPKNWPLLLCTLPICLLTVTVTILRWHLLLRTLGLQFTVAETLRSGFLAYFVNLAPVGLVGGDSLKAVMLIHRNPKRKTEAIATVIVDRILGLYALLLLAALASLFLPAEQLASLQETDRAIIQRLCTVVQTIALISSLGLIVMLLPGVTQSAAWDRLEHAPLLGPVLHKLVGAMRVYRRRLDLLLAAIGVSLLIHVGYVTAVALMAMSIGIAPEHRPSLGSIFIIVPPSMIAGALPIGFYEVTITLLFRAASPPGAPPNMGLLIALGYRLIQLSIAAIGLGYWLVGRSEVRELMQEAKDLPPGGLPESDGLAPAQASP